MKFLKLFDLYGVSFNFSVLGNRKFKSSFGGSLTILTVISIFLFTIFFGQELFKRQEPKVNQETKKPDQYARIFMQNSNFTIPWRLSDIDSVPINFTNFLYVHLSLKTYKLIDGNWISKEYVFNSTKCSQLDSIEENLKKQIDPSTWYCFDWSSFPAQEMMVGGYWDTDFINYIAIDVFTCNGKKGTGSNCTNLDNLKQAMTSFQRIYFETFIPSNFFTPLNSSTSIQSYHFNWYDTLNPNILKIQRSFLKVMRVYDDIGWIFSDINYSDSISFDSFGNSVDFKSDNDYLNSTSTSGSRIFSYYIFMTKSEQIYYRSYLKVQDIAAQVGGILKIIIMIISFVSNYYNSTLRDKSIISEIFECYQDPSKTNYIIEKSEFKSIINKNNKLSSCDQQKNIILNIPKINIKENITSHKKFISSNNIINNDFNQTPLKTDLNNLNYPNFSKFQKQFNSFKSKKIPQKNRISKFSCLFISSRNIFNSCYGHDNKKLVDIYNLANLYIRERLDVKYYLNNIKTFDLLRSLLLTKEQNFALGKFQKKNLYESKSNDILEFNLQGIEDRAIYYFLSNYIPDSNNRNNFESEIDAKLFENMDSNFKKFIEENYMKN